ncbi:MAG: NUDIX hydrolase [Actinomycetota bacterium]
MSTARVEAAGGVVVRRIEDGNLVVALIHRPNYRDWSLPKGKLLPGESHEEAALREVQEETGLTCRLGADLGEVSYRDRRDRLKAVRYWVMHPVGGEFRPNDEVDEVRWVTFPEALGLLSYPRDRQFLDGLDDDAIAGGIRVPS